MTDNITHLENKRVEISTDRVLLRGAKPSDANVLHGAFKDPEVMRYWSELPHPNQERTNEWINNMIESSQNGVTDFIICLKPDLVPVGKIGIWQGTEIGFLLARPYWGQGLAREALETAISYFFEEMDFEEITADTDPRNTASIGLLQKSGFVIYDFKERTFEIGGEWVDSKYLKLTKENWKSYT